MSVLNYWMFSHCVCIGYGNPHHNNGNNGFGMDSTLNNLNGMTNIPASVANNMMMGVPTLPSLSQPNSLPSAPSDALSTSADQRGKHSTNEAIPNAWNKSNNNGIMHFVQVLWPAYRCQLLVVQICHHHRWTVRSMRQFQLAAIIQTPQIIITIVATPTIWIVRFNRLAMERRHQIWTSVHSGRNQLKSYWCHSMTNRPKVHQRCRRSSSRHRRHRHHPRHRRHHHYRRKCQWASKNRICRVHLTKAWIQTWKISPGMSSNGTNEKSNAIRKSTDIDRLCSFII